MDRKFVNFSAQCLACLLPTMLQNPRIAFRDPRLQRTVIEKNEQNQPRPWAGAFAVVYKGLDPTGGPAVRVFTTESPERHERYDAVSAYLRGQRLQPWSISSIASAAFARPATASGIR